MWKKLLLNHEFPYIFHYKLHIYLFFVHYRSFGASGILFLIFFSFNNPLANNKRYRKCHSAFAKMLYLIILNRCLLWLELYLVFKASNSPDIKLNVMYTFNSFACIKKRRNSCKDKGKCWKYNVITVNTFCTSLKSKIEIGLRLSL